MKKNLITIAIFLFVLFNFAGCEFGIPEEEGPAEVKDLTINGTIVESVSGNPIPSASVQISDNISQVTATTNAQGKFTAKFKLLTDKELTAIIYKNGYSTDTISFFATIEAVIDLPVVSLKQLQGGGNNSSGSAASVYLYSQTVESVGVKESGSNETAQIIFQVLDSTGVAINQSNTTLVKFILGIGPGGGEYLYPSTVQTNALGRAAVTINTGTKSGVAQIIAEIMVNNKAVRSKPVLIAIHGGLPAQTHFGVASQQLNYPAYGIIGYEIPFTAFVGDKYTNPVRPGTSVYFETTSGIIEGSGLTDNLGRSTALLLTQPFPNHAQNGPGFFSVTASTIDENLVNIKTSTFRLLSGSAQMSVNPIILDIPNGGSQTFNLEVSDQNGNPLSQGTSINVTVSEGDIKVTGDVEVRLPDTQSRSFTSFTFTAYDMKPDTVNSHQAIILIETSGPNGEKRIEILGTAR